MLLSLGRVYYSVRTGTWHVESIDSPAALASIGSIKARERFLRLLAKDTLSTGGLYKL
jgi:hypothetical protein